jgi:hypothetical protein
MSSVLASNHCVLRFYPPYEENAFISATLSRPEGLAEVSPEGDGAPRGASPPVRGGLVVPGVLVPERGWAFSSRGCAIVPAPPEGPYYVAGDPLRL